MRNHVNDQRGGGNAAESLVRERVAQLLAAWSDASRFACACPAGSPHGANALECCWSRAQGSTTAEGSDAQCLDYESSPVAGRRCEDNFLPPSLNVSFDLIHGDDVIRQVVSLIPGFLRGIFTQEYAPAESAFFRHNDAATSASWDWIAGGVGEPARDDGIYTSYEPLVEYAASEAGHPFRRGGGIWR